ncbi:HNH endonuclease [Pararhizobium arenae]|uniref:HNH endonuclease n=1 Tax=Pararhizobium arenae TaxID=1856850 RepID=UPI000A6F1679|nr:HNH endonuclease signature motif containing protein [Pararhizobium arenae]
MKYLPLPPGAGDGVIMRQCRKPGWALRQARWLASAATYQRFHGNPWRILPAGFTGADADALFGLYDSRGGSGPIARIRRPAIPYQSCPMCGSLGGRSLDHALPRSRFPEFSILHENLVPACTMCNTDEKGGTYRGIRRPERFIHPYYDRWASRALWRIEFGPDLDALQFKAVSLPTLSRLRRHIVDFHVQTLLGKEWRDSVRREWGPLPANLRRRVGAAPSVDEMRAELEIRLNDAIACYGDNCWDAGFLRGVLADPAVVAKLILRVQALPG